MNPRLAYFPQLMRRPRRRWQERGWWGQPPLWMTVRETARTSPGRLAVTDEQGRQTYGELWSDALHLAEAMGRSGVERGDVILVQLPNWREFVALAVAAEIAGVVFAFCPLQWGARETSRALTLIQPRLWFTTTTAGRNTDRTELIRQAVADLEPAPLTILLHGGAPGRGVPMAEWLGSVPRPPADTRVEGGTGLDALEIAVTSGSTADPKGVVHIHDTALAAIRSTIRRQRILPSDVVHVAIPVGHTFGYFYGVRCALQAGGTIVLQERWDVRRMVQLIETHGVTVSLGPSAFVLDLVREAATYRRALARLRLFTHGGDSLPAPAMRRAIAELPFRISRVFGMTEFGHVTATDETTPLERCIDSVGSPQPEIEIRIADERGEPCARGVEGRVLVRGPFLFVGYLAVDGVDENVLDDDGFFDTGDLGFLGDDDYLHITGRVKNIIRRGAETVPAALLEDLIASHPAVQHSVVVGAPDPRLGEVPVACVQLRAGAGLTLREVEGLLEARGVTRKFWPVELRIFEQWPLGPTGKIDRRALVALVAGAGRAAGP